MKRISSKTKCHMIDFGSIAKRYIVAFDSDSITPNTNFQPPTKEDRTKQRNDCIFSISIFQLLFFKSTFRKWEFSRNFPLITFLPLSFRHSFLRVFFPLKFPFITHKPRIEIFAISLFSNIYSNYRYFCSISMKCNKMKIFLL